MQYTEETEYPFLKLESPLNINNNETNIYKVHADTYIFATNNPEKKLTCSGLKYPDCNKLYNAFEKRKI